MTKRIIPVASDHRGFELKARVLGWLEQNGHEPRDLGAHDTRRCDAMDYARAVADELRSDGVDLGVLICGSGQAMAMTANRYRHVFAALCGSVAMARTTREHNDANVLCLASDFTGQDEALEILQAFLETKFAGGKYAERRDALTALGGL